MDAIAKNVYIEERYLGVTLGVIVQPRGLIQIDAPPSPGQPHMARFPHGHGNGLERVLINLDAHPDRTLGVRAMDCTVMRMRRPHRPSETRPNTFKAQGGNRCELGSHSWPGSVRWAPPEISSSRRSPSIGVIPPFFSSRPGPSAGAIWVTLPEEKVIFMETQS